MPTKNVKLLSNRYTEVTNAPTYCTLQAPNGGIRIHVGATEPSFDTADFLSSDPDDHPRTTIPALTGERVFIRAATGDKTNVVVIASNISVA